VRLTFAVILILLGLSLVITWFAWIGPMVQRLRYDEIANAGRNSPAWWEVHHSASKRMWHHDDFENVGHYASKEDVLWIIESGDPGDAFNDCGNGHRSMALRYITNQAPGDAREAWQQWWKDNQDKTQNRWIMDGFAQHGITVTFPVPRTKKLELLRTIGRIKAEHRERTEKDEAELPLRHNALRLLRDDEFDPASITVQELTDDTSGHLMKGLVALAGFQHANPLQNGVGVVFVGEHKVNPIRINPVVYWMPWIWLGLSGACLWGGVRLMKCKPPLTPSAN
jgi:hypothetical protein